MNRIHLNLCLLILAFPAALAQSLPPVRPLGPRVAVTVDSLQAVAGMRQLSDGRILVNEARKRQLLLYDADLRNPLALGDPAYTVRTPYGGIPGPQLTAVFPTATLLGYAGDSSIFIAGGEMNAIVISPNGTIARAFSPPRTFPFYDVIGRMETAWHGSGIVYEGHYEGPRATMPHLDSVPIKSISLLTWRIDTIAFLRFTHGDEAQRFNPPLRDSWALLSDGTVAIIRADDRRIDFIDPGGARRTSPPVPHNGWTFADADGRLWVREMAPSALRLSDTLAAVYDVIDRRGSVVDRVELPPNSWIRGFGPGVVYLSLPPVHTETVLAPGGARLAKYRIR